MTDKELQALVLAALEWETGVDAAHIGVAVDDGVVTLSGHVASYAVKLAAEHAVTRIKGVRGLAEALAVRAPVGDDHADDLIADRARRILDWDVTIPADAVSITVERGRVTLDGTVESYAQKRAAERALRKLGGVSAIHNRLEIRPAARSGCIRDQIEAAFKRDAALDGREIAIVVDDGRVVLRGEVGSWRERELAAETAYATAGVTAVENLITVG